MKWVGDLDVEKKHFVRYHLYSCQWLKLITCGYTCREQNIAEKITNLCKKDDRLPHQKSRVFFTSKWVGLPLELWFSRKALKFNYRIYAGY